MPWLQFLVLHLRGGVNLAPSPSLSTGDLCSPHFLPLWHAGVCRSWFDISVLCQSSLLPDGCYCYQLPQGKPSTLQVTLGHYLLPYPVPPKLVLEEDSGRFWWPVFSCGFENSCSRMGCFGVLGLRVWDFFSLITAAALQCRAYSNSPPHLKFSSLPLLTAKSTETGKLWSWSRADRLVDETVRKLSLSKLRRNRH